MPRTTDIPAKLAALRAFAAREHRMPGYGEMLRIFNYRSKSAVHGLLTRLQTLGHLTKSRGKIALVQPPGAAVRLLGAVRAGFPSPADEELLDTISLDEFLVEKPDATFMLKVSGDSMLDAGIHPGDLVLVERGTTPRNGDIVIAQVDGEWTMKYFVRKDGVVQLEAANRKYAPIRPRQTLEVAGVVRTVIRKYT